MPILLKKPLSVGDLDSDAGAGYPHCALTNFYHSGLTMAVTIEYQFGEATGQYYENWQRGKASPTRTLDVSPQDVVRLWSQMPQEGETVGQAMRRLTYEYMIESGLVDGTIVNTPPLPPAEETVAPDAEAATDVNADSEEQQPLDAAAEAEPAADGSAAS